MGWLPETSHMSRGHGGNLRSGRRGLTWIGLRPILLALGGTGLFWILFGRGTGAALWAGSPPKMPPYGASTTSPGQPRVDASTPPGSALAVPLLLAAIPPELAGLDNNPPDGWVVGCTGVGAVAAAVSTMDLIRKHQSSQVLFVGTCGAYGRQLAIGDLIEVAEVQSVSLDELWGNGYKAGIEQVRWPATLTFAKRLGFQPCNVAVTLTITKTAAGAQALADVAVTRRFFCA